MSIDNITVYTHSFWTVQRDRSVHCSWKTSADDRWTDKPLAGGVCSTHNWTATSTTGGCRLVSASVLAVCVCATEVDCGDGRLWVDCRRNERNNNGQAGTTTIECGEGENQYTTIIIIMIMLQYNV